MRPATPLADRRSRTVYYLTKLFGTTWRFRLSGQSDIASNNQKACIYAFWHEYLLPVLYYHRKQDISLVLSTSRDGRRLGWVCNQWGYKPIWGSSSRGGETALANSIETLGKGRSIAITPDGPRGPRRKAKRGVARIARQSHAPVIAIQSRPSASIRLLSWDRFQVPLPFCTINMFYSKPIYSFLEKEEETDMEILLEKTTEALGR
jgi:hypothetical protein